MFDPERHRPVLGNRQEAKEQKGGGREERGSRREEGERGRRTGPARWARQSGHQSPGGSTQGPEGGFLLLPWLRASEQPHGCHLQLHSLGP